MRSILMIATSAGLVLSQSNASYQDFLIGSYGDIGITANPPISDALQHIFNATGHLYIDGYDISKPWPASKIQGWSLELSVAADIPAYATGDKNTTGFITAAGVYLFAPAKFAAPSNGANLTVDNSTDVKWLVCPAYIAQIDASNDDGSCKQALGSDCARDLKQAAANAFNLKGSCSLPATIPSTCSSKLSGIGAGGPLPFDQDVYHTPIFSVVEDGQSGALHQHGNYTAYDKVANTAHAILVAWGGTNQTIDTDMVTLNCIKANYTRTGSRVPGVASDYRAPLGLLVISMVVASFFSI